jgi:hypothetical protein
VEQLGLDRAGEFLEVAAMLVRIKAQMLLPRRADEAGELEDPRAELVRRLLEYEHFREASLRLETAEADRGRRFARGFVPPRTAPPPVTELELSWEEVPRCGAAVSERLRGPRTTVVATRAVPVEDKIGLILHTLARIERVEFRRLVQPFGDRLHGVVTLPGGPRAGEARSSPCGRASRSQSSGCIAGRTRSRMRLTQIIEALLFASDAPLSAADLSRVDERLDEDTVRRSSRSCARSTS